MDDDWKIGPGPLGLGICSTQTWDVLDEAVERFCEMISERTHEPAAALARALSLARVAMQVIADESADVLIAAGLQPRVDDGHVALLLSAHIDLVTEIGADEMRKRGEL